MGKTGNLSTSNFVVNHTKCRKKDLSKRYAGHEIAVHTLTHPKLTLLSEKEIIRQVEEGRLCLSRLVGDLLDKKVQPY